MDKKKGLLVRVGISLSWTNDEVELLLKVSIYKFFPSPQVVESWLIRTDQGANAGDCVIASERLRSPH